LLYFLKFLLVYAKKIILYQTTQFLIFDFYIYYFLINFEYWVNDNLNIFFVIFFLILEGKL